MNTVRAKVPRGAFGAVKMISRGSAHSGSFSDLVFMGGRDNSPGHDEVRGSIFFANGFGGSHHNSAALSRGPGWPGHNEIRGAGSAQGGSSYTEEPRVEILQHGEARL
jgi:hypothetical protein